METVDNRAMSAIIAGGSCQRVFVAANEKVSGACEPFVWHLVVIQSGKHSRLHNHNHFNLT